MTKVVNIRKEGYDVYIGRGSPFGNQFIIGRDGCRKDVIQKYRVYFNFRVMRDPEFRKKVLALKDKTLGCFCRPEKECHGDVIREFLDSED